MSLLTNLISYWKFDESSGNAADSVGSNTLTNNGSTAFATGKINNGADLEQSSSQSFSIADASQSGLDIAGNWSVSAWIKVESFVGGALSMGIINKDVINQRSYSFSLEDDGKLRGAFCSNLSGSQRSTRNGSHTALSTATWYHVVIVCTVATPAIVFYVNNTADSGAMGDSSATSVVNGTADFYLGFNQREGAFGTYFDGIIDEVGIWDRVLTSDEVTSLYNGGAGLAYPFSSFQATPMMHMMASASGLV